MTGLTIPRLGMCQARTRVKNSTQPPSVLSSDLRVQFALMPHHAPVPPSRRGMVTHGGRVKATPLVCAYPSAVHRKVRNLLSLLIYTQLRPVTHAHYTSRSKILSPRSCRRSWWAGCGVTQLVLRREELLSLTRHEARRGPYICCVRGPPAGPKCQNHRNPARDGPRGAEKKCPEGVRGSWYVIRVRWIRVVERVVEHAWHFGHFRDS